MTEYTSITNVANMAYALLGDFEIDDIDDNTDTNAKRANKWYESNVRAVIRQFSNWGRCEAYYELTNDGVAPLVSKYGYKVNIPPNVISIMEVTDSSGVPIYPWKVVGQKIYSNVSSMVIRVQEYVEDPNLWDPLMLNVVAIRLAWILCIPVTGDKSLKKELRDLLIVTYQDAVLIESQEGSGEIMDENNKQTEDLTILMGY